MKNKVKHLGIFTVAIILVLGILGVNIKVKAESDIENANKEKFNIYSMQVDTAEKYVLSEIYLPKNIKLEKKLEKLADNISEEAFRKLPIVFKEIKEIDNKKVAIFNLEENKINSDKTIYDEYEGTSWYLNFFQGTAGTDRTKFTLTETILQRELKGEWIDGVTFLYKGNEIQFENVKELSAINFK